MTGRHLKTDAPGRAWSSALARFVSKKPRSSGQPELRNDHYELIFAPRKTLGITVHPDDLRVIVKAPEGSALEDIEAKVLKRASWILKQQQELERYLPHLPPRQYVSGETHRQLGRQHRLKVVESENGTGKSVERDRNYIYVYVQDKADTEGVKALLDERYRAHARRVFAERLEACYPKVEHIGVPHPEIVVRAMSTRWGSCSPNGRITLNVKLVRVPKSYIDYHFPRVVPPGRTESYPPLLRTP